MLLAMQDAGRVLAGRPAMSLARPVLPDYPDIPAALPVNWLPVD
ncbi:MAG TPA: hypothetical protein VHW04_18965 [Solirubrobacteraceae bacterium]|jgi:hypothetical protein|nr:hypothetical protein [Solirubrobacteraceae bacterium]